MMIKKDKIELIRNSYLNGLSLRAVSSKEEVCLSTVFKYCKDILRNKSMAKKGKIPKNIKIFIEARKNYKFTEKHRKEISERNKRLGIRPPSRKGTIPWNFRGVTPLHERIRKSDVYFNWRKGIFSRLPNFVVSK